MKRGLDRSGQYPPSLMTSVAVIFIFAKAMTAETDTVSSISEITGKTAIASEAAAHSRATEVAAPKAATMEAFASVENGPRSAAVPKRHSAGRRHRQAESESDSGRGRSQFAPHRSLSLFPDPRRPTMRAA